MDYVKYERECIRFKAKTPISEVVNELQQIEELHSNAEITLYRNQIKIKFLKEEYE